MLTYQEAVEAAARLILRARFPYATILTGDDLDTARAVLEAIGYADLDLLHQAAAIGAADSVLHLVAMQRTRAETAEAEVERLRRPFPCCSHCSADPGYHQENPRDSHDLPCTLCDDPIRTERDALLATLARVKVEGDRWANSKNYTSQFAGGLLREALRPPSDDDE